MEHTNRSYDEALIAFTTVTVLEVYVLAPKLLLPMGCVKLGEKNCVYLP